MLRGTLIPPLMGWSVTGDFAGYTFYTTRRHKIVWYPQAPPLTPASPDQISNTNKMRAAAAIWHSLPAPERRAWQTAARRAHLSFDGFALLFSWVATRDLGTMKTIMRQSGITLRLP